MIIDLETFLFLGWFAVIGGLLNTFADWFLLAFPVGGQEIKLAMLAKKPAAFVRLGAYLAWIAIPMWIVIVAPVSTLLRGAPYALIAIALVGMAAMAIYSLVYHVSYIFYDTAYRYTPEKVDLFTAEKSFQRKLMTPIGLVTNVALLIGGILSGAPWWWLVANPLLLQVAFFFAARSTPAPIGGYFLTGAGSLSFTAFALITMVAVFS
ncbi:MAG: hypothetical protein AAF267_23265 [Deinococcota bacterium]